MSNISDEKKDIAIKILNDICGLSVVEAVRYPNGYCHSVYFVKTGENKYVLRVTGENEKDYYKGALKWLPELDKLGIPVPQILKYGKYEDSYFVIISFISGSDNTLSAAQKRDIAKDISGIQRRVSSLPPGELYGYTADSSLYKTWTDFLNSQIKRSGERIEQNGVWGVDICNNLRMKMNGLNKYFTNVRPTAFLADISTKNVLVHEGKLSGIVDVDEICYGDSLFVVGLTNMALLATEADTDYVDYWLGEIGASEEERKAVIFYTLLFCLDFMGEQGMKFDNGNSIPINRRAIEALDNTFVRLYSML